MLKEEKLNKILRITSISVVMFCGVLLFPAIRNFIIGTALEIIGRNSNKNLDRNHNVGYYPMNFLRL